jgi:hypothetical protein
MAAKCRPYLLLGFRELVIFVRTCISLFVECFVMTSQETRFINIRNWREGEGGIIEEKEVDNWEWNEEWMNWSAGLCASHARRVFGKGRMVGNKQSSAACCAYFSTLKMEAVLSSETSVNAYQTTRRYNPEDTTLQSLVELPNIKLHEHPSSRSKSCHMGTVRPDESEDRCCFFFYV